MILTLPIPNTRIYSTINRDANLHVINYYCDVNLITITIIILVIIARDKDILLPAITLRARRKSTLF